MSTLYLITYNGDKKIYVIANSAGEAEQKLINSRKGILSLLTLGTNKQVPSKIGNVQVIAEVEECTLLV